MIDTTFAGADAVSYATVAAADSYHSLRVRPEWAAVTAVAKEAALIRATDEIEASFRADGTAKTDTQALQWPRQNQTAIPANVIKATIELARHMLTDDPAQKVERQVAQQSESMDGLGGTSVTYESGSHDPYPFVTRLLSGIATRRGAAASNLRVS